MLQTPGGSPSLSAWAPGGWPTAPDWQPVLDAFFASPAGRGLAAFVQSRLAAGGVVYPAQPLHALALTPLADVRAVILGQDPYHGAGQAHGLAFSVPAGMALPPSLRNIFLELGLRRASGELSAWARQGVLLLNTVLTVEAGQPGSHSGQGWEALTDALLAAVAARPRQPCAYLLWGRPAQAKADLIERTAAVHGSPALVLQANHPSPLAARRPPTPFIGCGHFGAARRWLADRGYPGPLFSFGPG